MAPIPPRDLQRLRLRATGSNFTRNSNDFKSGGFVRKLQQTFHNIDRPYTLRILVYKRMIQPTHKSEKVVRTCDDLVTGGSHARAKLMDGNNFDDLTRKLATGASRRSVLRGLLGGAAALGGLKATDALAAKMDQITICHQTESDSGR